MDILLNVEWGVIIS